MQRHGSGEELRASASSGGRRKADGFESSARRRDARPPRRRLWDWLRGHQPEPKPVSATPDIAPSPGRVGICCSGGGIRSACFNLGALQVLREKGELERAEYVSAVSGGCYMAASFAAVAAESPRKLLDGGPPVYAPGSPEEQHLRNNSTYLAPGLGGKLRLLLRFLLGLAVNLFLIALAVYLLAVPFGWLLGGLYHQLSRPYGAGDLLVAGWTWCLILALAIGGVALAVPDLLFKLGDGGRGWRDLWSYRVREVWSYRLLAAAAIVFFLLVVAPQLILWARGAGSIPLESVVEGLPSVKGGENPSQKGTSLFAALNLGAVVVSALGAAWAFVVRRRSFFAILAGGIAGPLVVLSAMLWFANLAATENGIATPADLALAAFVAFLLWLFSDLTQWSLHPFYRRRLSSAFFVRRVGRTPTRMTVEEIDYRKPLRISKLDPGRHFPKLIVCAAANISDPGETPPGRAATPFVFTAEDVGGPLIGRMPVREYEHQAARTTRDITLPAAVAMSGAAVSPAMGKKTIRALTFLMALSNLRLGVWVPNPRYVEELRKSRFAAFKPVRRRVRWLSSPLRSAWGWLVGQSERLAGIWGRFLATVRRRRATPIYLFREMLGLTKLNDRFLYVTDGGHYDNLGLIELLRRGCTTIYCFDGGGDPSGTFRALGEAVALARSDLQVEIDIDPSEIIPDKKTRISKTSCVLGTIRYRATPTGGTAPSSGVYMGTLVYCRTAVTEDAPWDVRAYHEKSRRFPYHSTLDQLFDDQKFEAYRALGAHTARRAVWALQDLE
jgi:hypothetical protein